MNDFTIKNASLEEMDFFLNLAGAEGWNPSSDDASVFFETDPNGYFIGLIGDKKIGCISAVAYNSSYGFMGFYIVLPEYRGQGFGIQLWDHAIKYLGNRCIGLDGVISQQENYKKSQFHFQYRNIRFKGNKPSYIKTDLTPFSESLVSSISSYDTYVYGLDRSRFLYGWLRMPNALTLVKLNDSKIVGFGTIRQCVEGYKIGPLFAQSQNIAREIYHGLCNASNAEIIFFDVPEINTEAVKLAESLKLEKVFETARMYNKTPPKQQIDQVFGVTTFELG